MFASLRPEDRGKQTVVRSASVALHGALLVAILWAPTPQFLTPSSVAAGKPGAATAIYFSAEGEKQPATRAASDPSTAKSRLTFRTHPSKTQVAASEQRNEQTPPAAKQETAGSPYGSGVGGPLFGPEVRPALPVVSVEPQVYPWQLGGMEGDVIVEVTIDDHGKIVEKKVVHSFSPEIDLRVLAALEGWQFTPATRDGVPIASKQDVYYHFRPH